MKKNILIYGLISGLIVSAIMVVIVSMYSDSSGFEGAMWVGYASMLIAFSMIYVGVKNYRDKYNGGAISFGKAFKIGILIALIASTIYVIVWMFEYQFFFPDFMEKYADHEINRAKANGASGAELAQKIKEMDQAKEMYKNPILRILMTYAEILPVGLLVSLLCALILKRKQNPGQPAMA